MSSCTTATVATSSAEVTLGALYVRTGARKFLAYPQSLVTPASPISGLDSDNRTRTPNATYRGPAPIGSDSQVGSSAINDAGPLEARSSSTQSGTQLLSSVAAPAGMTPEDLNAVSSSSTCADASHVRSTHPTTKYPTTKYTPIFPVDVQRYDRNITIDKVASNFSFEAFQVDYSDAPVSSPSGWNWKKRTHPEGAPYFCEETQRICTDANLMENETLERVERFARGLVDRKVSHASAARLSNDVDLVVELDASDTNVCKYYLVDHLRQLVVWMHDWEPSGHTSLTSVDGAEHRSHIAFLLRCQYWNHWELFPTRKVPKEVYEELQGTISFFLMDAATSRNSTSPYSPQELQLKLDQVIKMRTIESQPEKAACIVGRLLSVFEDHKYMNFYGRPHARLCQDQSVHKLSNPSPSILFRLFSVLLFRAPSVYLADLERIFVDELVTYRKWTEYITYAVSEWTDYSLWATVVLTATVGLLTIQTSDHPAPDRSFSQILSYCAAVFSVASVVSGLTRIRRHRKSQRTANEAATYLSSVSDTWPFSGLESPAVIAALPFGFLAWGILCFLAALAAICFEHPSKVTAITMGAVGTLVFALVVWSIAADGMWVRLRSRPRRLARGIWRLPLRIRAYANPTGRPRASDIEMASMQS